MSDFPAFLLAHLRLKLCPHFFQPRQDCFSPFFAHNGREELQQPYALRRELFVRADELLRAFECPTDFERVGLSGDVYSVGCSRRVW